VTLGSAGEKSGEGRAEPEGFFRDRNGVWGSYFLGGPGLGIWIVMKSSHLHRVQRKPEERIRRSKARKTRAGGTWGGTILTWSTSQGKKLEQVWDVLCSE